MDRKSLFVIIICLGVIIGWQPLMLKFYPPAPEEVDSGLTESAETEEGSPVSAAGDKSISGNVSTNSAAFASAANAGEVALTETIDPEDLKQVTPDPETLIIEETLTLENSQARYIFSSVGGGIRRVELKEFPERVDCSEEESADPANVRLATLNAWGRNPIFSMIPEGSATALSGFTLTQLEPESEEAGAGLLAQKTLPGGIVVSYEYRLDDDYLVQVTSRIENPSGEILAFKAHDLLVGAAAPIGEQGGRGENIGLIWYNGSDAERIGESWFANRTLGCFPGEAREKYLGGSDNVRWAAAHNQFFAMIAVPEEAAPAVRALKQTLTRPDFLAEPIGAPDATGDGASTGSTASSGNTYPNESAGYQVSLVYPREILQPGETVERKYTLYLGPRKYATLDRLGSKMKNDLSLVMDFGFFGMIAEGLLLGMNGLNHIGLSYGWAIVAITVMIKLLFWPLTAASSRSMKRMAALQPQMKELQAKYKDEPQKLQVKMMEFWKEHKVNPFGGCLPLLLQMPIFFGFFTMLRSAVELRGASFLWACDLSKADTVGYIPGLNFPINPFPLLMGVTMIWQARTTPPSPGVDPAQQKIMKYMPLMFMVFLYNFSAGLTVYWTVQNLLSILQMKLTKADPAGSSKNSGKPVVKAAPIDLSNKKNKKKS